MFSCANENKKIIVKPEKNTEKVINRNIDFITKNIIKKITTNPKVELDSFTRSKILFKQFNISNGTNNWTYNTEFYENGILKEKGLYLNGWSFGKWFKYNKNGKLISEIDYNSGKIIIGENLNYENLILKLKSKSDSLLIEKFGKSFFDNHIKLNAERSYWYNSSNSGNLLEQRKRKPKEVLFKYSIIENDTIIFTPIKIKFAIESNFIMKQVSGVPNRYYNFKIDYHKAYEIAQKNGFGIKKHNNEFRNQEYLNLFYDSKKQSYYWTISNIPETSYSETNNVKIRKGIGKSMIINCENGKVTIKDFSGSIIYD